MPKIDYQRLVEGVRSARLVGRADREYRLRAIQRFRGLDSPVNLIEQYVRIVTRALVAKEPRIHLSSFNPAYTSQAHTAQAWYNQEVQKQELARVFQRCVYDAFIKLGVCKVALATPGDLATRGYAAEIAEPLCSYVSFDDFVYDSRTTDLYTGTFVGHRFRLPLEVVRNMKMYGPDRKTLQPATDGRFNQEGDLRASALQLEPYYKDFEDWVELWELYLPRHGVVVTLADEQLAGVSLGGSGDPLRVQKWLGPACGPYVYWRFNPVPDQALPNGTLTSLLILDEDLNELYRKLIRQAKRQKSNTLVDANNDKDNKTYKAAQDGDLVPVGNPAAFSQVERGGPNKINNAFAMELRDIFNRLGGNLETLGGVSPQAKTLGQERLLNQNSSATLADMQNEVNSSAAKVCRNMLWYYWYHPTKAMQSSYTVPGTPISAPLTLSAQQRHSIRFEDLDLKLDPYSMPYRDPAQILDTLVTAIVQVFLPMGPMLRQAGVTIDLERLAQMFGELQDMPEFAEILQTAGPSITGSQDDFDQAPGPGGARQSERINRSEATQPGQDGAIRQALLGQDAGGAQSYSAGAMA
jgi:hypothetical protein